MSCFQFALLLLEPQEERVDLFSRSSLLVGKVPL